MFIATKNYLIPAQVMSDSYVAHDLTNSVSALIYKDFAPTGLKAVACRKQETGKDARAPQPGMAALRVRLRAHDDGI